MPSPETSRYSHKPESKVALLIELAILDELIQPYLETALAIDEMQDFDELLDQRDWILDDLEQYQ